MEVSGLALVPAKLEACRTRFRPILMTALATIIGILPIALWLGVAVVGGMLFAIIPTFFIVPATYISLARFRGVASERATVAQTAEPAASPVALGS